MQTSAGEVVKNKRWASLVVDFIFQQKASARLY